MNETWLSPHRSVLKGFTGKVTNFDVWQRNRHSHTDTHTDTHIHTRTNKHPGIIGVSYKSRSPAEIQRVSDQSHTHAHTACDWCAAQRPQSCVDGLKKKKKKRKKKTTSGTLNYLILIWFPACGSKNTGGHTTVIQREKQRERRKDSSFN